MTKDLDSIYSIFFIDYMDPDMDPAMDPDAESMPEPMFSGDKVRGKTTESIDKLTMELLVNKKHYKKIVEKTDPKKYEWLEQRALSIRKYKRDIQSLVNELIDEPTKPITNDINDAFEVFLNVALRYFQMKDLEKNSSAYSDDEVMFDFDRFQNKEVEPEPSEPSLWGKERVLKRTSGMYPMPIAFPRIREKEPIADSP